MPSPFIGNFLLALVALVAVLSTLLSMAALAWMLRPGRGRRMAARPPFTPPVTILKPLKGLDEDLEENLRSFFRLDYPVYQLVFGVANEDDPAGGVVRLLLAEFPEQDAKLVVGCPPFGLNPKVENLASAYRYRKHDVVLISDSNVRVRPEYLRETACYLAEPGVGLVTNLFAGVGETRSGAIMENLQINGFIAGNMALASVLRITCVVGKSMMIPVKVLEGIGGFARVRNLLAEDQVLGVLIRKSGYSIKLSHHVIDNVNLRRGFNWFLNRHSRWFKIRRQMATATFVIEPTANLAVVGLVWAFSGDSGIAWGGLAVLVGLGIFRDAVQTRWLTGKFPMLRYLLFSPLKDVLLLPLWFDAVVNSRVQWRGHRFRVGRLTRLRESRASREVRRRLRRARRFRSRHGDPAAEEPHRPDLPPPEAGESFRAGTEPPVNPRDREKET
ncbi:glycosyltransferase [Aquisphaera insulae]|uniref:glycosyltransferase n=1 Tax=Aquisphaera insulae TaxID=2712864 RepID=UPI0013EA8317|nr:glycosyltransferase [Aquisphaera insulae]